MSSTAPSGPGASPATARGAVDPDPALAMDLGRAHDGADQRSGGALGDRDVGAPVRVEQAQGVLRAVADVRVAADGRDGEEVELRAGDGQADGQRVVEARVAVDDERQRMVDRPERRGPRRRGDR